MTVIMNWFSNFFKPDNSPLPEMPRQAYIYFNEECLLVASAAGCYPLQGPNAPFDRFSSEFNQAKLGEFVLHCIHQCVGDMTEEVFETHIHEFFRFAGASGWNELESQWNRLCVNEAPDGEIDLFVFQKCVRGGYATDCQPVRINGKPEVIGLEIKKMIENFDYNFYDEGGPSHT